MNKLTCFNTKVCIIIISLFIIPIIGLSQSSNVKIISLEDKNKEILKRLIVEGYNKRKMDIVDELVDSNYVEHTNGVTTKGSGFIKKTITWLAEEAPDFKMTIEDIIAEEENAAMRWVYTGKNIKYAPVGATRTKVGRPGRDRVCRLGGFAVLNPF